MPDASFMTTKTAVRCGKISTQAFEDLGKDFRPVPKRAQVHVDLHQRRQLRFGRSGDAKAVDRAAEFNSRQSLIAGLGFVDQVTPNLLPSNTIADDSSPRKSGAHVGMEGQLNFRRFELYLLHARLARQPKVGR